MNVVATSVFVALFLFVTVVGFMAARWRRGNLDELHEWGLGGRQFGTVVTWFLLGGDLFTAFTVVAIPALAFGTGAMGMFAIPFCIVLFPFIFIIFPRLWNIAKQHGYVTVADFVHARYGSKTLALAVAVTGIVALMPYIALQLVGLEVAIGALGFDTTGIAGDIPLTIAFALLAAYTWKSGLRAPALIAVVKDMLIYVTVIAAAIIIPGQLGGFEHIFAAVPQSKLLLHSPTATSLDQYSVYVSLAIGSAVSAVLYPHAATALLSSKSGNTVRRNMALLPMYTLLLGFITLLGYMAIAAGVRDMPEFARFFTAYGANFAVPALFLHFFPSWLAGLAFAAIGIGALVPAAIMSIAAANLYTRNVHRAFVNPHMTGADETRVSKLVAVVVKIGAVAIIFALPVHYATDFQLLGGVWIIQTLPAVLFGLFGRKFDHRGLLGGLVLGLASGTWMVAQMHFKSSVYPLQFGGYTVPLYSAIWALILNIAVAWVVSARLRILRPAGSSDDGQPGSGTKKTMEGV
ncbi:monocarboxylate uptake permease MctP [Paraburkholderia lycopersici]|uniref:Solute:Na+ symporter, SSS family n=1 Tax=Paraburkholderia lycopersici TaxID=416944 RepID=A0A1G6X846_9BURK|nr:sodium:solute symporter family protein [Paraburkholderia lycopersici]SDD74284.1 solute:Na+ symporter, SSS family [Paraburkholderia lycopersici]